MAFGRGRNVVASFVPDPDERADWDPKFPEAAIGDRKVVERPIDDSDGLFDTDTEGWTPYESAPATSHIVRFRICLPRRKSTITGTLPEPRIRIQFKDNEGNPQAEYDYWPGTRDEVRAIFQLLKASDHPYSKVAYPLMIEGGKVPYKKVGQV